MSKRVITLGTWSGNPIEWIVLKEDNTGTLVISRYNIGKFTFGSLPWGNSSLRNYLENTFFKSAFSEEEKKKIINVRVDNVKDNVFILTRDDISTLLLKNGDDDYERIHYNDCSYCIWTRTTDSSYANNGYAKGCWCRDTPSNSHAVRPAMYVKE